MKNTTDQQALLEHLAVLNSLSAKRRNVVLRFAESLWNSEQESKRYADPRIEAVRKAIPSALAEILANVAPTRGRLSLVVNNDTVRP